MSEDREHAAPAANDNEDTRFTPLPFDLQAQLDGIEKDRFEFE